MPETTISGTAGKILVSARVTQSVGVPSTEYRRSLICRTLNGRLKVNECAVALCSEAGATTQTSPIFSSALANAAMPSEKYPSSFVTRIFDIITFHLKLLNNRRSSPIRPSEGNSQERIKDEG